jgi:hypothetical protein
MPSNFNLNPVFLFINLYFTLQWLMIVFNPSPLRKDYFCLTQMVTAGILPAPFYYRISGGCFIAARAVW